ncbi:MAG TPA: hypothetical protein VK445_00355 [Dissulfurispiraceae bacterium]|nr:hypothetical protein [Dissulfurispiraceae bacterium]
MATIEKAIRQSITLPSPIVRRVKAMAKSRKVSANRVLRELVESGLQSKEDEKLRFFKLAEQLQNSTDTEELQKIKAELARMTFGA